MDTGRGRGGINKWWAHGGEFEVWIGGGGEDRFTFGWGGGVIIRWWVHGAHLDC